MNTKYLLAIPLMMILGMVGVSAALIDSSNVRSSEGTLVYIGNYDTFTTSGLDYSAWTRTTEALDGTQITSGAGTLNSIVLPVTPKTPSLR